MNAKLSVSMVVLSQKLQEITVIYHLYHEYLVKKRAAEEYYQTPDIFTLTTAFAEVFPDLHVVLGMCGFVYGPDMQTQRKRLVLCDHAWLVYDDCYIIDLVPHDGIFGVSVPQVIIPEVNKQRFFPTDRKFPESWGDQEKINFDRSFSEHLSILQELSTNVPF